MTKDLVKYEAYRRLIENLVFRCGISPHCKDKISLYRLITIWGLCVANIAGMKILVYAMSIIKSVPAFMQAIQNATAVYAPMLRMVLYLIYRKELAFLDNELGQKFREELKDEQNRPVIFKKISLYTKFLHFLNLSTGFTIFLYWFTFVILNFKYKKSVQIMLGKYPFHVEPRSPLYWAIFAYETSQFWFTFHSLAGVDSAFGKHCFHIGGLLCLAGERFKNLNLDEPKSKDVLRECVAIHQMVIRAKVALQRAYGVIIISYYLVNAIVMCSLLWQIDQIKNQLTAMKVFFFVAYMFLKLTQTFIYAYYGSSVTYESENYQQAIYDSTWSGSANVSLMKDLLFVFSQRTVELKACGFFFITMSFFEKICNTSISYFFLLQSLDKKH